MPVGQASKAVETRFPEMMAALFTPYPWLPWPFLWTPRRLQMISEFRQAKEQKTKSIGTVPET